ncbi:hypothetical protein ACIBQ2_05795 [Micromonospora sediminimaris]
MSSSAMKYTDGSVQLNGFLDRDDLRGARRPATAVTAISASLR